MLLSGPQAHHPKYIALRYIIPPQTAVISERRKIPTPPCHSECNRFARFVNENLVSRNLCSCERPTTYDPRRFFSPIQIDRHQLALFAPAPPMGSVHHLLLFADGFLGLSQRCHFFESLELRHALRDDLFCQLHVAFGSSRLRVVKNRRLAVAWSFCQPNVPRNRRREQLLTEESLQFSRHLLRQIRAVVEHRQQNAFYFQRRIQRGSDPL